MLTDFYGNPLHTSSQIARDAYVEGQTAFLQALPGTDAALDRAIAADDGFALAYVVKARNAQAFGRVAEARTLIDRALELGQGITGQARAQLNIFDHLIHGRVREGYARVRAHLLEHPRDAMVAQTSLGVYSLIGFSGQPGRESEHLALAEMLAPAYGEDGWFLGQLAFAQIEAGQLAPATKSIDAAQALCPGSAHGAHFRAHLFYEEGRTREGLTYLSDWMLGYDRTGMMHCHNSWHCALWSLALGDTEAMWRIIDADLMPEQSQSPPLNILTDLAALYHRAGLAGIDVPEARWQALSGYAREAFPAPALGFADIHAALAHAMAGQEEPLMRIINGAKGPAADQVAPCARAFRALAAQDWAAAEAALLPVMASHERLGGSRAQRDLLEHTLWHALIRQGKADEARRLVILRRPQTDSAGAVQGLAA